MHPCANGSCWSRAQPRPRCCQKQVCTTFGVLFDPFWVCMGIKLVGDAFSFSKALLFRKRPPREFWGPGCLNQSFGFNVLIICGQDLCQGLLHLVFALWVLTYVVSEGPNLGESGSVRPSKRRPQVAYTLLRNLIPAQGQTWHLLQDVEEAETPLGALDWPGRSLGLAKYVWGLGCRFLRRGVRV